jgi:hypothetical protein
MKTLDSGTVLAQSNQLSDSMECFLRVTQGGGLLVQPDLFARTDFHLFCLPKALRSWSPIPLFAV